MRILIIEDEGSIRRMLEALVSARADDIAAVSTGEAGLDKAKERTPDLVLLDLNLPGLYSGLEVCKRLRADPKTRKVPIFVITAADDAHTHAVVAQAGATRFFPKPFSPMAILKEIDEVRRVPQPSALPRPLTPAPFAPVRRESSLPGRPSPSQLPQTPPRT